MLIAGASKLNQISALKFAQCLPTMNHLLHKQKRLRVRSLIHKLVENLAKRN